MVLDINEVIGMQEDDCLAKELEESKSLRPIEGQKKTVDKLAKDLEEVECGCRSNINLDLRRP